VWLGEGTEGGEAVEGGGVAKIGVDYYLFIRRISMYYRGLLIVQKIDLHYPTYAMPCSLQEFLSCHC